MSLFAFVGFLLGLGFVAAWALAWAVVEIVKYALGVFVIKQAGLKVFPRKGEL